MIRRFLIALALLAMATAAGIALGTGVLADSEPSQDAPAPDQPAETVDEFSNAMAADALRALNDIGFNGPELKGPGLNGTAVVLVALPGADPDTVDAIEREATAARAQVTAVVQLGTAVTDPSQKMLVSSLGEQLVTETGMKSRLTGYPLMGRQLGLSVATTDEAAQPPGDTEAVLRQSLNTATFITGVGPRTLLAPAVVLVSGDEVDPAILTGLLTGLVPTARALVVTGPSNDPNIEAVRADAETLELTTFDGNETEAGTVATISAMQAQLLNQGGDFGASGSDGPAPIG